MKFGGFFRHGAIAWCAIAFAGLPAVAFGAQLEVSNVGRGSPARYVKVVGRDITGESHGDNLHVLIGEIRLESVDQHASVRYSGVGVAIFQGGKMLGATWDFDVGGELTAAAPSIVLTARKFQVPWSGLQCAQGGCEVRLQLRVEAGRDTHAEHTDLAALSVTVVNVVASPEPEPSRIGPRVSRGTPVPQTVQGWEYRVQLAMSAISQQHYDQADRLLREALAFATKTQGRDHPAQARVHYQWNVLYERQSDGVRQEQALLSALAILEKYPDSEVQRAIGTKGGALDKEIVARRLGDLYWSQQRYDRGYEFYNRAYRCAHQIQVTEADRNQRLARSSAGRMATACSLEKWDIADRAMKELKERIKHVDERTRKHLEYWIRTGDPRLAARKC